MRKYKLITTCKYEI